jgi:hypothetical protein
MSFTVRRDESNLLRGIGYKRINYTVPTLPGYKAPQALPGAFKANAVHDPYDPNRPLFIGAKLFRRPFDMELCAALCNATTEVSKMQAENQAKREGKHQMEYKPCNYFNGYIPLSNGVPEGVVCAMYSSEISYGHSRRATRNITHHESIHDLFFSGVSESYGYAVYPPHKSSVEVSWEW